MGRYVRRLLIGASLLLCIAVLLLWVRSYFAQDLLELHRRGDVRGRGHDDIHGVFSARGSIGVGYVRIEHPGETSFEDGWVAATRLGPVLWPMRFNVLGFSYWDTVLGRMGKRGPVHVLGLQVPHALFAGLLGIAPALAARRFWLARRRRLRIAGGLCAACGYDVRASAQRCPECGAAPERVAD